MYATAFWAIEVVSLIAIVATLAFLVRTHAVTTYDVALLILPFALWFILTMTGVRPKSLSNLTEAFALLPILAICLLLRSFRSLKWSNTHRSMVSLVLGLSGAVAIYAFVPLLPE